MLSNFRPLAVHRAFLHQQSWRGVPLPCPWSPSCRRREIWASDLLPVGPCFCVAAGRACPCRLPCRTHAVVRPKKKSAIRRSSRRPCMSVHCAFTWILGIVVDCGAARGAIDQPREVVCQHGVLPRFSLWPVISSAFGACAKPATSQWRESRAYLLQALGLPAIAPLFEGASIRNPIYLSTYIYIFIFIFICICICIYIYIYIYIYMRERLL